MIGRGHRMMMLERLINHYRSLDDVVFTTLIDYADHWRKENPLEAWLKSGAIHARPADVTSSNSLSRDPAG